MQSGRYAQVSSTGQAYISNYGSGQGVGNMRFNIVGQNIEVFDGNIWIALNGHASIGLTVEAESLLDWAKQQRDKERRMNALVENNPQLKPAYENLLKAEEQLEILAALVEKHTP
jgi:hypothetical protein